jgi:hypothetical protein
MIRRSALLSTALLLLSACVSTPIGPPESAATDSVRNFVVMIEGRNFVFDQEGTPTRFGFSATRYVSAKGVDDAKSIAIQGVFDDETLNESILNSPEDPPRVIATHAVEVKASQATSPQDLGYIFYRDRDSK